MALCCSLTLSLKASSEAKITSCCKTWSGFLKSPFIAAKKSANDLRLPKAGYHTAAGYGAGHANRSPSEEHNNVAWIMGLNFFMKVTSPHFKVLRGISNRSAHHWYLADQDCALKNI